MTKVLDKGFVNLEDTMGNDLAIVNAAKVSFGNRSLEMTAREEKLINYLMKHRHGTPFEHVVFKFHVKAPLFVVREWQRHRIGSFNEMSGRYVQFEPDFYIPDQMRIPAQTNKQGSVVPEEPWANFELDHWNKAGINHIKDVVDYSWKTYEFLIQNNVAKELARLVLPLNLYTEFIWTVNARSLMNFMGLRSGEDAQWEIRQYSDTIIQDFKELLPVTYRAWEDNGRVAP